MKVAGEDNVKVFRGLPSYLTPEAGRALIDFKERDIMPSPEQLRIDRGWEQHWLKTLIARADGVAEPARRWRRLDPPAAGGLPAAPAPGPWALAIPGDALATDDDEEEEEDEDDVYS